MAGLKPIFKIQIPDSYGEMLIVMQLYHNNKRLRISTSLKIKPEYWNKESQRPVTEKRLLKNATPYILKKLKYISVRLDEIEYYVNNLILDLQIDKKLSLDTIKNDLQEFFGRKKEETGKELTILEYYDDLIKRMEEGKIHTVKGTLYAPGTIKSHKSSRKHIASFKEDWGELLFSSVSNDLYNRFISYSNNKGYRKNTIVRAIKALKFVVKMGLKEGIHTNDTFRNGDFRISMDNVDNIYLTLEELKTIYDLQLTGKEELHRDIFLIGCYTAQRFSDYSRIAPEHIKNLPDGTKVIDIITQKTGERVVVPFLFPELDILLQKYNYSLPKVHPCELNKAIKKIGQKAGINETVVITEIICGKRVDSKHKKYELIKSHTARRSGATNMIKMGYSSMEIMKVTGHISEGSFMKYIKLSKEENAKRMTDKKK